MSSHVRATLRGRRAAFGAGLALTVSLAATGCAEEGETPDTALLAAGELEGWGAAHEYPHDDVLPYDQVAAAPGPDGLVWVTRAGGDGTDADGAGLAVYSVSGGQRASEAPLAAPAGAAAAIPVGVAADAASWTAVAVTRDQANGGNTGLVAWRSGGAGADPAAEPLQSVVGGVPAGVTVGQAEGSAVVAGLVGGEVATWVSGSGGWTAGRPRLEVGGGFLNARVSGAGERFLLAGVDAGGAAHLWSSPDGLAWTPLELPGGPAGLASVAMLAPLPDGGAVVGWLAGEVVGDDVPREGTAVIVQQVGADDVVEDAGVIEAAPGDGVDLVDVNGAVQSGNWLVVAGATLDDGGTAHPAVWASAGNDWARSSQDGLVDQDDRDFRTLGASGDGSTYGLVASRTSIDVEVWRGSDERN